MHCDILIKCPPICYVVEITLMTSQRLQPTLFEKKEIKEGNNRPGRTDMS